MEITKAGRPRQIASWASLACIALLLTACNSSASSAASSPAGTVSTPSTSAPVTGPTAPTSAPGTSAPVAGPTAPPGTPASSPGLAAAPTEASTFLAAAQSLNGTLLHEPACGGSGCALSGDSTAFLSQMKWTTWSGSEAVGTGTYKLDDCNPNCAAGQVYSLATVVTLSQPVKVCSASGTRWVWTHAFFIFPQGLPQPLTGQNAPQNPWTFSGLVTAAQQTCAT
jgi:hypothetical protein